MEARPIVVPDEDDAFLILEGELTFVFGDEPVPAGGSAWRTGNSVAGQSVEDAWPTSCA